ncbi:MAG TPA: hypothetical protein VEL74_13550 [Thermoanaerobaculia bacterium]|nr:hypothetical protein [Thermoanaerobaculia bacterium]
MALPLIKETPSSPALTRLRGLLPQSLGSRLKSAGEMVRARREEEKDTPFQTAVPAIDRLLEGGLPRGQLVELIGGRSSGRFSTELAVLAAATGTGETAALVDLGDSLDPEAAIAAGVDLERLLWVRPQTMKQALAAAEMLLGSGFALVILDMGYPPVRGGRGVEAAWLRLARAAESHTSALLVGSPYRVSGTAAAVVLKAGRSRVAWQGGGAAPWLLTGLSAHVSLEKHRGRLTGQTEGLDLAVPESPLPSTPPQPGRGKGSANGAPAQATGREGGETGREHPKEPSTGPRSRSPWVEAERAPLRRAIA